MSFMALKPGGDTDYFSCITVYSQAKNNIQSQVADCSALNIGAAILGGKNQVLFGSFGNIGTPFFSFYSFFYSYVCFSITYCILHSVVFLRYYTSAACNIPGALIFDYEMATF